MFVPRLISGIFLVLFVIGTVWVGDSVLLLAVGSISLIGMFELYRVFGIEKRASGMIGYLAAIFYFLILEFDKFELVIALMIVFFMLEMAVYVFEFQKITSEQTMASFFGLIYLAFMLSYIYKTRMESDGIYMTYMIFISAWGCDTFAYCTGMLCKKFAKTHQMTPVLSPKKSIEGAIGGVVGAFLLGVLYGCIFGRNFTDFSLSAGLSCGIICAGGGLISMIGDLSASAIKRNHNVKDYGHLIPGHGGILDRFDSIIFTAPIIYYLAMVMKML
ncbi:MAG: phosphatidate cytidylyltransferase [Lachnospiraceae bacterium]